MCCADPFYICTAAACIILVPIAVVWGGYFVRVALCWTTCDPWPGWVGLVTSDEFRAMDTWLIVYGSGLLLAVILLCALLRSVPVICAAGFGTCNRGCWNRGSCIGASILGILTAAVAVFLRKIYALSTVTFTSSDSDVLVDAIKFDTTDLLIAASVFGIVLLVSAMWSAHRGEQEEYGDV